MNLRALGLGVIFAATFSISANAQLLNFDFKFSSDNSGLGNTPGTVTGEIFGLQNNTTSAPSEVIITSAPTAFATAAFTTPIVLRVSTALTVEGDFKVSDGSIQSGSFLIDTFYQGSNGTNETDSNITFNEPQNFLRVGSLTTENDLGFAGVTYTLVEAPEPSEYALLLVGGVVLFAGKRFFRAKHSV
jgi:hypothetical protein